MTNARAVSRTLLVQPDSVSLTRVGHFLPSCGRKVRSPLSVAQRTKGGTETVTVSEPDCEHKSRDMRLRAELKSVPERPGSLRLGRPTR